MAIASGWFLGCSAACSQTVPVGGTGGWCQPGDPGGYGIFQWDPVGRTWKQIPDSWAVSISVDLNGIPWVTNTAGQIFKWTPSGFVAFGGDFAAAAVASGSNDAETWAIALADNSIWNWSGTAWRAVPGAYANKIAVFSNTTSCGDHVPWVMDIVSTVVYQYTEGSGCSFPGSFAQFVSPFGYGGAAGNSITTDFVVGGPEIYEWDPAINDFDHATPSTVSNLARRGPYSASPFGANTEIGGWANGLFARDAVYGTIQLY